MSIVLKAPKTIGSSVIIFLVFSAQPAYALQAHGYIGLHAHLIAHGFFIFSMIYFAIKVRQSTLIEKKSWRLIMWGAWLLTCWNIWAASGHVLELFIPLESIMVIPPASTPSVFLKSWKELVYYVLKMDHLLSIPAAICFLLGLKTMVKESEDTIKT